MSAAALKPPAEGSRSTILVVDDDPDIREALADELSDAGYRILLASDGADALAQLISARELPKLVILDLKMPNKTGYEVLDVLRHSMTMVNLPVVVLSAHLGVLPTGAVAWLRKPITRAVLLGAVERFLAK
jgi:CheY-like chemotaxis protein